MNWDKAQKLVIIILGVLLLASSALATNFFYSWQNEQLKLSDKDAQIQRLDTDLGLAESSLLSVRELNKKFKTEINEIPGLKDKLDEFNLELKSRDRTIASLRNKIKGGTTVVTVGPKKPNSDGSATSVRECDLGDVEDMIIAYAWTDPSGRFNLTDPDIFIENNEEFTAEQYMVVTGKVFFGKDGQLQVKHVEIKEMLPDGIGEDGKTKYKEASSSSVALLDSQFDYTNNLAVREKGLLDVVTLRPFGSFNTSVQPGLGLEIVNLGRWIDYANIGLNVQITGDFSDPLGGSLQRSQIRAGIHYHLLPPILNTNFAVGASVGVPFNNLSQPVFSVEIILFLTEDLSPLKWFE